VGCQKNELRTRYSDLNLDTQAGAAALYQRIRHAAEQVCGKTDSRRLDQLAAAREAPGNGVMVSRGPTDGALDPQVSSPHLIVKQPLDYS
jgi:hypothetical protein